MKTLNTADVAVLIVKQFKTNACGLGYYGQSPIQNKNTFSVVDVDCCLGYYSMAHEIGHNAGANHNHGVASGSDFPDGYGYIMKTQDGRKSGYRTIMAYNFRKQYQYY